MCDYLRKFNEGKLVDLLKAAEDLCQSIDTDMPCLHIDDEGKDSVDLVRDGTGDVFCHVCNARWSPVVINDVEAKVAPVYNMLQSIIWLNHKKLDDTTLKALKITLEIMKKMPELYDDMIDTVNNTAQ